MKAQRPAETEIADALVATVVSVTSMGTPATGMLKSVNETVKLPTFRFRSTMTLTLVKSQNRRPDSFLLVSSCVTPSFL